MAQTYITKKQLADNTAELKEWIANNFLKIITTEPTEANNSELPILVLLDKQPDVKYPGFIYFVSI